ncbi:MAG: SurA N-terminal domain-containing protein [Acidobacteria bacterium]|nr:SurA N-terminal domain-containing protein [Acidobacteriota bacterium]
MLKSMRKNLKQLAPALWFVIVAFIISIFAVWGGAGQLGERGGKNLIARIGKEKISSDLFYSTVLQRLQQKRARPLAKAKRLGWNQFVESLSKET